MSLTDIKSPTWRCRKKRRRGAGSLDWSCHGEETVWHFLLLSQFWNPVGDSGSCVAARSLWLWDNLWELRECKNWIYSCRWRRSSGRQGRVSRAQASGGYKAFFDYIIRLPSSEQPDLVKVLWIGFVTVHPERVPLIEWTSPQVTGVATLLWVSSVLDSSFII